MFYFTFSHKNYHVFPLKYVEIIQDFVNKFTTYFRTYVLTQSV